MSSVADEIASLRAQTAAAEQRARDDRYRAAVIEEAGGRGLDVSVTLAIVDPDMFVRDDDGTPLNVKQRLDELAPLLTAATERKREEFRRREPPEPDPRFALKRARMAEAVGRSAARLRPGRWQR